MQLHSPSERLHRRPFAGQLFTLNQTSSNPCSSPEHPTEQCSHLYSAGGFKGSMDTLKSSILTYVKQEKQGGLFLLLVQLRNRTTLPQHSSPGVMKAFFTNKDTVSSFGAGTIFCDCLGLVPALAKGTGLGSANVSWDCSWGRGCPCTTAVWKARLQGTPAPGCCVASTRLWLWLWLKVVAGALWVSVAEAV